MSDSFGVVVAIAAGWVVIGLALSIVMGRRGHNSFGWLVLGALLGPLAVVLAVDARRAARSRPSRLAGAPRTPAGSGPIDVLVGYDGSPESVAALEGAVAILGQRIGRLTVATVVSYDDVREQERLATAKLRHFATGASGQPAGDGGASRSPGDRATGVRDCRRVRADRRGDPWRRHHQGVSGQRGQRAGEGQQGPRPPGRRPGTFGSAVLSCSALVAALVVTG